jgi:hypothetical protein
MRPLPSRTTISLTPAQIAQKALPSVALIRVSDGVGTGFVVSPDGRIATNLHVIAGNHAATIVLADGREFTDVEILAVDASQDLALLRVDAGDLTPLPLGDSDEVIPGERVVAIGNPFGLGASVSDGLVSGLREITESCRVLQISAPLSPGSSGGPLFNERGQVIGVSTLVVNKGQNLNFAIPINSLKPLLDAGDATPLKEWKWPRRVRRDVPSHDEELLEGCTPADLARIVELIERAISVGAPLYNEGNHEACFRIYQGTALEVDRMIEGCEGPRRALLDGVRRCESLVSYTDKAWAMRDAFDGMLEVIERGAALPEQAPPPSRLPPAPRRAVPKHPTSLLHDCPAEMIDRIGRAIVDAISVGAPLYNDGNFEACFRIYEGTILDLGRKLPSCPGARRALLEGIAEAGRRQTWSDKAWALRDAFDGMLDLIERAQLN